MDDPFQAASVPSKIGPLKLWSPTTIAMLSVFLGFPGGIILACINWQRMGNTRKAWTHLAIGGLGTLLLLLFGFLMSGRTGACYSLLINLVIIYYFYSQMEKDIETVKANKHIVQDASWLIGALICLATLAGMFVALLAITFIADLLGILI